MTPFASVLLLVGGLTAHQAAPAAPSDNAGTYLGILFAPVASGNQPPAAIPEPPGVVVTQVLAESPAVKGGVRRNDLLRRYVTAGPLEHDSEPAPPAPPGDDEVAPLSFAY